jgi:hypothetical protein
MKDYKARGSNLKFRERKSPSRGVVAVVIGTAALAAVVYGGSKWFFSDKESTAPADRPAAMDGRDRRTDRDVIPLVLPPPPASYDAGVQPPSSAGD